MTSGEAVDDAGQSASGPDRSLDLAGSIVKGRYRLNALASAGRDVVVYTAEDTRYRRPIALKVLRDEFAADPAFVAAVRDQAGTLAMLSHAHRGVARVYECDTMEDGRLFVAVERTKGATLREVLDARGPLDPSTALRIASRIGEALEALHHSKIIHGQLGPHSVLIVPDAYGTEHVTLVDVELTAAHRTPIGLRLHETSPYRAPEQIERGETAETADVYALGMLLRELLTAGRAHGTAGDPQPLPPAIERIISTALDAQPERRYPDLSVMVNDIWGAQAGFAQPESRIRPTKPRSPVAVRARPARFPHTLRIAAGVITAGVIAVIVWLASDRIAHFRAGVTAPVVTVPTLTIAPVERSLMPPPQPLSPPAQPLPIEPASAASSTATTDPGGTSTRSEPQPVKDVSPVEEPAPAVAKPAPAPAPAAVTAPAPAAVRPERSKAPIAAPVVVDRPSIPVESKPPAVVDRPRSPVESKPPAAAPAVVDRPRSPVESKPPAAAPVVVDRPRSPVEPKPPAAAPAVVDRPRSPVESKPPAAAPAVAERPRGPVESKPPADRPATANRPVQDQGDGSAIIDWLLENRR